MIVVLATVLVGLVVGVLAGGSFRNFERVTVHWWGAVLLGLLLQVIPFQRWFDDDVAVGVLLTSYALLIAFAWVNRRLPAAPLLLRGARTQHARDRREPRHAGQRNGLERAGVSR